MTDNVASVCELTLRNCAYHYKYHIRYHVQTKTEAINSFRREAYVILLIAEKLCNDCELKKYRELYNQLKDELNGYMTYLE